MALVVEELVRSVEKWTRPAKKRQGAAAAAAPPAVNPNLDPVLLVPGIAGCILNAVDDDGREERVWVRIFGADHKFRTKLWSRFDPCTGKTLSLDEKTRIVVPEGKHGLYAVDVLDPDMIIQCDGVCYFHDMIEQMIDWGFKEGKTLFGFGYDFRQSNRLQETMYRFSEKLESAYNSSGGKKLNVITHSMGGLLVKCFMSLHGDVFGKYVKNWIAIAAPFRGAPGYVTTCLLNGMSFLKGWEQNLFISKWSMHQLLIECPSIYEMMACPGFHWDSMPLLQIWREKHDSTDNFTTLLESYEPEEAISIMNEALLGNTVEYNGMQIPSPFNLKILEWAYKTHEVLSHAKLPATVKFYNIYGVNCDTPHTVRYGSLKSPVSDLQQLLSLEANFIYIDGDGTVPVDSAKADGLNAVARVGVPADHRDLLSNRHVFRIIQQWLKAGEPDPFYSPHIDYVILPTAFEIERLHKEDMQSSMLEEEWEVITSDDNDAHSRLAEPPLIMGTLTVSHMGMDDSCKNPHSPVVVHRES